MLRLAKIMQSPVLQDRTILVVEDEVLILMDITQALLGPGASVTSTTTLHHALLLVEHDGLSDAILDHVLGYENSAALYARLTEQNLPFLIYSGMHSIKGEHGCALLLQKPASQQAIVSAVVSLISSNISS